jgi:hypothetical protein
MSDAVDAPADIMGARRELTRLFATIADLLWLP